MKTTFRRITRRAYKLELSKTVPSVDTEVDESKAFHPVSSPDHTDMLAIARRQHRKATTTPAASPAPLAANTVPKSKSRGRSWLRLFGLGAPEE